MTANPNLGMMVTGLGVGGGLVPSLDFKSNGRPQRSTVGSIPTYPRHPLRSKDIRVFVVGASSPKTPAHSQRAAEWAAGSRGTLWAAIARYRTEQKEQKRPSRNHAGTDGKTTTKRRQGKTRMRPRAAGMGRRCRMGYPSDRGKKNSLATVGGCRLVNNKPPSYIKN